MFAFLSEKPNRLYVNHRVTVTALLQLSKREKYMAEEKQRHSGLGRRIVLVAVEPEPKPRKGVGSKVIDFVEKVMVKKFMYNYDSSINPNHYLSHNFAPVLYETPPTNHLFVKGYLPVRPIILHQTQLLITYC